MTMMMSNGYPCSKECVSLQITFESEIEREAADILQNTRRQSATFEFTRSRVGSGAIEFFY
jgi:hypothetical protein